MSYIESANQDHIVWVKMLKDCPWGKKGMKTQVSAAKAKMLIDGRYAEPDTKAIDQTPAKRGPGRPRKVHLDNKAVGA